MHFNHESGGCEELGAAAVVTVQLICAAELKAKFLAFECAFKFSSKFSVITARQELRACDFCFNDECCGLSI